MHDRVKAAIILTLLLGAFIVLIGLVLFSQALHPY
jgi:hypothetical protein